MLFIAFKTVSIVLFMRFNEFVRVWTARFWFNIGPVIRSHLYIFTPFIQYFKTFKLLYKWESYKHIQLFVLLFCCFFILLMACPYYKGHMFSIRIKFKVYNKLTTSLVFLKHAEYLKKYVCQQIVLNLFFFIEMDEKSVIYNHSK